MQALQGNRRRCRHISRFCVAKRNEGRSDASCTEGMKRAFAGLFRQRRINPLGTGATLRLYVQADHDFRPLARAIGSGDVIGTDPSLLERLMSVFR
jgi:hypothetical protein